MPKRGINTSKISAYIKNTFTLKAPSYKKYLEQQLDKLINLTKQENKTYFFSLKILKLADLYYTQLKQTQVFES